MRWKNIVLTATVLLATCSIFPLGAEETDPEDPRWIVDCNVKPWGTYLRICDEDAGFPTFINLAEGTLAGSADPGDWIILRRLGYFKCGSNYPEDSAGLLGVFSAQSILWSSDVQNRLLDAIFLIGDPGYVTAPTWNECSEGEDEDPKRLNTDIPQDFYINVRALQVPEGAAYLFLSPNDVLFEDNTDPNNDFKLRFTDEVKWDGGAEVNSWSEALNWDIDLVPRSDFGVTFDLPNACSVSGYDADIQYLRFVSGKVSFAQGTAIKTLAGTQKFDFLVDNAMVNWNKGDLKTGKTYIGKEYPGIMKFTDGNWTLYGPLYIGFRSNGMMEITGMCNVYCRSQITIGEKEVRPDYAGEIGLLAVKGADAILTADLDVLVGPKRSGNVWISNGGRLSFLRKLYIGRDSRVDPKTCLVLIQDPSSLLDMADEIIIREGGHLLIQDSTVALDPGKVIRVNPGGKITGCNNGRVVGSVINQGGEVGPGCSTGTLIIEGDFVQEADGTLAIEIGGRQAGVDYDVLEVTGNATLDGTLRLEFVNGYAPKQGDVFEVAEISGLVSGAFAEVVIENLVDDFQYRAEQIGGKLTITALSDATSIAGVESPGYQITGVTSTLETNPEVGGKFRFTIDAVGPEDIPVFYTFFTRAGYGLDRETWGGNSWQVIQESPLDWVDIWPESANNIYVACHVAEAGHTWKFGDPQGGFNVVVSGDDIQITEITSTLTGAPAADETFRFTVNATGPEGMPLLYSFYYRAGYGLDRETWGGNSWQLVQGWSSKNWVDYSLPAPGNYFLAGHVVAAGESWEFGDPQGGFSVIVQ